MRPYIDIEVTDKYIIREFSENIDPIELLWHRDDEDRTVEILEDTDWKLQLEDQLPTSLKKRPPLLLLQLLHIDCKLSGLHISPPLTLGIMWSTVWAGRLHRAHCHPSLSSMVMRSFFHFPLPIARSLINASL